MGYEESFRSNQLARCSASAKPYLGFSDSSTMAYVPPHMRHSKDADNPTPSSLIPHLNQSLTLRPNRTPQRRNTRGVASNKAGKAIYASRSISRWWTVGSDEPIPPSFTFEPVDNELIESSTGVKPLALMDRRNPVNGAGVAVVEESPWVTIAERIQPDLVASLRNARNDLGSDIKQSLAARVGKIHFDGRSCLDAIKKAVAVETDSRNQVRKTFYTNLPNSYVEEMQNVVPKIGLDLDCEKEHYHVKVFDKFQPDSTITCKCTVVKGSKELEIHKIELNSVRQLVVDVSCLYKDLDLRLIMVTKRTLESTNDEEKNHIDKLIKSAVVDDDVKGGLRWPLGEDPVDERFSIVGIWHTKYKAFRGPGMRLKLRHADRFNFRTSIGEVSDEMTLKLNGISNKLKDLELDQGCVKEMLGEAVKLIWNHFLSCNRLPST